MHNCYIDEYDSIKNEMNLLTERTSGAIELSDYDFGEADANDGIILVGREWYHNWLNSEAQHFPVVSIASFAEDLVFYEQDYDEK